MGLGQLLQEKLFPTLIGSPEITVQLKLDPPVANNCVPTPWHIVTFWPAYVLVITVTPTAAELMPTIGQALSFTSILIVENGFVPGAIVKQKVAVAGVK